ncbi:PREDICTED: formin-like protein 2 [Camelina sativa]|uniref:Formin-like protein 2 n=1 Tax=Camelina sativa TaxID=90675 RepID=A0ABM0V283_CAMSA|nr:PREDICTED: formin-like protein 2 [Camelina sativa]
MVEARSSKKPTQLGNKEDQNPTKFYSRFIFKALILTVLCAVVPVFLSQTPELANQTRLLELLHLIFVGIAVSYGLFSRRNYDGGGGSSNSDHNKADHHNNNSSHSYVPKILEVSSVFNVGHESESEPSDDSSGDHRKFQTWKNKYHMKIPDVETRFVDRVSSEIRDKPLLLPVRSLNYSRVPDSSGDNSGRWDKVRSKRKILKTLGDDNGDVLPSPIPWSSRSSSSSSKEIESLPSIKNLTTVESQPLIKNLTPSSSLSSPRKSNPLPNLASPPPPPPPPPPLPAFYNSSSRKVQPGIYRVERRESVHKTKFGDGEFHPPPPPPPPPPVEYYKSPPTKFRLSSERRKSSEQKMRRNSPKKVWWSDPIVESKEQNNEKNDQRSNLGSKEVEEFENEEQRRRENEIHNDEVEKKIIEEEGVCESNNVSDVDKKADEFIAKFREQIRLQRIESIKRSANKISASR